LEIENQHEWIVFNSWKNTLITERNGNEVAVYGNDSITNKIAFNTSLKSYLIANNSKVNSINKIQNLYYFKDKKIHMLISSFHGDILIRHFHGQKYEIITENFPKNICGEIPTFYTLNDRLKTLLQ
jgi:hypothetical protein